MWELDCEEGWVLKNWYFWTVVLEKTLESPLDCKEIQPVHSKGDQPWVFFGRIDAKAETPILWPPQMKSWLIGRLWCWEGLEAGGEGDDRGWDGWMASPTWWTWVWVNSGRWWLSGASVRNSAHGEGHEERGLAYAKARSSLRKPPVPEYLTPKPESVLCSYLHFWLYGGLSPITVSLGEGVNVQLQGYKNSWVWQECFSLRTPLKVI